ncbi:glycosyltransferase family protein [Trichothermofontia sp.]
MNRTDDSLCKLIPPDAAIVVEINDAPSVGLASLQAHLHGDHQPSELQANYRSLNPHGQYLVFPSRLALEALSKLSLNSVDCLVFNQSLGSVANPVQVLKACSQLLRDNGLIIACAANIHHWRVLVNIFQGNWPLHLTQDNQSYPSRFFSLGSLRSLLSQAELHLLDIQTIEEPAQDLNRLIQDLSPLLRALKINPQEFQQRSQASHFLIRATQKLLASPKLLIHTYVAVPGCCGPVRVYDPDQFSATIPCTRIYQVEKERGDSIRLNVARPDEAKVFIWQRTLSCYPDDLVSQKTLLNRGYLIVSEWDDDPRLWQQEKEHDFFRIRSSHCVQVATEAIANFIAQFNPHVKVFANQLTRLPSRRTDLDTSQPILFFGGVRYPEDWQPIVPALNRIFERFPQVQIKVIHAQAFFDALKTPNKIFYPLCPPEQYHDILHTCHIGILPLADTEFNRMKSDLKFLEHAGQQVVSLASPVVYANSLVDGKTGLLYHSPAEFEEKLAQLIEQPSWRQTIADNAYQWVQQHRLLSQHYRERRNWYLQMLANRDRLTEDLKQRVPELFT